MQVDKSFDQFSHDLTIALEETSRGVASSRWGLRRRTRSTGNLPCPPQPTEDSSSTDPNDMPNDTNNNDQFTPAAANSILSDSDDRSYAFAFKIRQTPMCGNFESDSFNENFSPSKPNIRRKRKFKRMAVEYETTPSTPHASTNSFFPVATSKKRVFRQNPDSYRSNLFFGKRKRPFSRYADYDSYRHSSSVPRHRGGFLSQKDGGLSYLEYKSRNRTSSMTASRGPGIEKILPLNKNIVSKIEKISRDSQSKLRFDFSMTSHNHSHLVNNSKIEKPVPVLNFKPMFGINQAAGVFQNAHQSTQSSAVDDSKSNLPKMYQKSESFESALPVTGGTANNTKIESKKKVKSPHNFHSPVPSYHSRQKQSRRLKLQFDDQNFMDCGNINDFLSSSSLSSSDSETEETNESDHEGDDELTDWPGYEAMVNFTSKNEFRRPNKKVSRLSQIKQDDMIQDDDTLMSTEEMHFRTSDDISRTQSQPMDAVKFTNDLTPSNPIKIANVLDNCFLGSSSSGIQNDAGSFVPYFDRKPIESEMSGEASNHFSSSPNVLGVEGIREIRAGCRRVRDERPGFSIITSFNEELLRFLQDEHQKQTKIESTIEYDKILELAKLYKLLIQIDKGCIILKKTSNTMQAVKVSKEHNKYFFSDYKRRCVGGDTE